MEAAITPVNTFCPPFPLRNPHIQSVTGKLFQNANGITFRRHRLDTPDGDFIDLDFADVAGHTWQQLGGTAPIVVVLHGHLGSARRGYACETYRQLAQAGIRSVGMNFRACSGEVNRLPQAYHAGLTEDIALVVDWLRNQYPVALRLVGFSLGASMLLKYLGEAKRDIVAAAAVSPPFDLSTSSKSLSRSIYNRYVLSQLKDSIRQKSRQVQGIVDIKQVMETETVYEFDEVCTAPLHGFKSVEDYYTQCSCSQFLPDVKVPTLIIRSLDDPFFDSSDIPFRTIDENPQLYSSFPRHGGHAMFADWRPWQFVWWAQQRITLFLKSNLL